MDYKTFKEEIKDWNVSTHFKETMRIALTSGAGKASFSPKLLTTTDMKWLHAYGYELNTELVEVEV